VNFYVKVCLLDTVEPCVSLNKYVKRSFDIWGTLWCWM